MEEELRDVFARHEHLTPDAVPVRRAIDGTARRRRTRRNALRSGAAALAVAAIAVVPVVVSRTHTPPARAGLLGEAGRTGPVSAPAATADAAALDILVVGTDDTPERAKAGDLARADAILVVHVSPARDRVYVAPIPRDTVVRIPPSEGNGYPGGEDRINAAFAYGAMKGGGREGGMRLLSQTVAELTGLRFDGAAVVDFAGLANLVDGLGGVDLCVDARTESVHIRGKVYPPGCHHFAGWEALDFVRQRKGLPDGDYTRQRHVQQLFAAIADRIRTVGGAKAAGLVSSLGPALIVDGNGRSVADWALMLRTVTTPVLLRVPGHPKSGADYQGEELDPLADDLFGAIRAGTVDEFLVAHPELRQPA